MAQTYSLAIHKADSSRNLLRQKQLAGPRKEVSVSLESTDLQCATSRASLKDGGTMAICPK